MAAAQAEIARLREQLAKAERRLQAREGLLKGLSQHIPGVLFKVLVSASGDTRMVYISERAAEIYELGDIDPATLTWSSHYVRIHPDDRPIVEALSRAVCEQPGELRHYEYRVELPHKGLRWMAGQSVGQPEGEFTAWYGYVQDVTEQKLYAEALIQAQTAERANHAKSEFLSRMSHEIRTPLNAITGFAQLLRLQMQTGPADVAQRNYVDQILHAGRHLSGLVNDVLDLQQVEAGVMSLRPEVLRLDEEVVQCLSMLLPMAEQREIAMSLSLIHI